jgi:hypothetical protein
VTLPLEPAPPTPAIGALEAKNLRAVQAHELARSGKFKLILHRAARNSDCKRVRAMPQRTLEAFDG